jgi:hypothetical protein
MQAAKIIEAQNILGEGEPWEHGALGPMVPSLIPIRIQEHTAKHCFSACLYHEPTFQERFPQRDYKERYLERCADSCEAILREGHHLNIICDQASLQDALSIPVGSVFLCTQEPKGAFAKHLFRYYSPLLPAHPTIQYWHFRGMDNILKSEDEPKLIADFAASGCDVLRSPYFPIRAPNKHYIRVRGSCSVNLRGAASLAHFLTSVPLSIQTGSKAFHCDEFHLDKWFQRDWRHLRAFTLVDRAMYDDFYRELKEMIAEGVDQTIRIAVKRGGPMSSTK